MVHFEGKNEAESLTIGLLNEMMSEMTFYRILRNISENIMNMKNFKDS